MIQNKQLDILDDHLLQNSLRIKVHAICNLEKINDQYFVREKSVRKLYHYYREIGIKNTAQKILSRIRENIRNEKYFSIGIGKVLQSTSKHYQPGQAVYFIASNHPACSERLVIYEKFVFLTDIQRYSWISQTHIVWLQTFYLERWWDELLAWSPYSGLPAPNVEALSVFQKIQHFWNSTTIEENNRIFLQATSISEERSAKSKSFDTQEKRAALFGYGNYAKTMLIPNVNKNIKITTIHEIDPTQIIPLKKNIHYDTSPLPRHTNHDIYFIAGYHHTHADLVIAGLKNGIDVVVEKPLMTTKSDLAKIIDTMRQSSSRLYACFQRRHHRFNNYMYQDFQLTLGDPVSYYAIIYEESLPKLHWYRWPNSCSAIISNGCHWIDHFLFLNHFSPVLTASAQKTKNSEIIIVVELINGATLSLTLSHLGSARIGMQEYIELRSGKNTVKISNGNYYQSENASRIMRRSKINKYESYKKMYQLISQNIVDKNTSRIDDSWEKVDNASSLILSLDEELSNIGANRDHCH